ncbi:MAG: hypothetical protein HFJ55_02820 [Clostridia bacterium]|nr:hypothetical protein [Clostridia bacterium]
MKNKIIFVIILIAILLGAGVAYAYFATDTLKSEKDMFFSYLLEDKKSSEIENKIADYAEKKGKTPYTNKGETTVNLKMEDETIPAEVMQMINNGKITFEGTTNSKEKKSEQNVTIDLSQGVNVPIKLKRDNDFFGLQTDLIDSKYIAIKNENLKALAEKFDIDSTEIPDKIDFETTTLFTEKEEKELKNKYIGILRDNLGEELFSKEKKDKQTIITLNIPESKLIEVVEKILEELRNDEIISEKLTNSTKKQVEESIDQLLDAVKGEQGDDTNKLEIKLYVENRKVTKCELLALEEEKVSMKIEIEISENEITIKAYDEEGQQIMTVAISTEKNGNDATMKMNFKLQDAGEVISEGELTITYKNLFTLDNVEESISVKMSINEGNVSEEAMEMGLNYKNTVTFAPDAQIEALNEQNATVLNTATDAELQALMTSFYQKMGLI